MTLLQRLAAGAAISTLALASATAVYAQQTTAAVSGVAVDDQDKPVANATVTITHVPTGTKTTVVTDSNGLFSFGGLRVGGPYRVSAAANGFEEQAINGLFLNVGDDSRVKLAMVPAGAVSELVVTAAKNLTSTQLANVGSRTTLRSAQIETVVSVKRDIRDVARRDPLANLDLVSRSTGPSGGLYIAGSSPRRNRITIDGVRSQDDFGLNTGGLSTNRGPISLEAVEQVSIQAVPFDVEEGDFTGGALNLILKQGSNDFHGSVFGFFRTPKLVGDTLPVWTIPGGSIGTNVPTASDTHILNYIHEKNYGGFISGPIWKDRLFFAASYEKFASFDLTSVGPSGGGFATSFNPLGATVGTLGTPGGAPGAAGPATQANIDAITGLFKVPPFAGSFSPGTVDLAEPLIDQKYSVKLDFNITNNQRLDFTYRHADSSVWKRSPSTSTISLDTNWYVQPEVEDNYSLQLNSTWTPQFTTEARVAYRSYTRGQNPPEGQGFANVSICSDPGVLGGGTINTSTSYSCSASTIQIGPDQFRQANVLSTTDWSGEFIANYRLGDHHLKAGYQYKGIHLFDLFVQAAHGIYYFDSLNDFAAGTANQLTYGGSVDGKLNDAAAQLGYQVHTLLGQDTWDVNQNLTVNYGLRVDIYKQGDKPPLNTAFQGRYGFTNQKTYDGQVVWQPRFSAKYRTEDYELSGGIGRVSGGIPDVFIANSFGAQTGVLYNSVVIKRTGFNTYTDSANNVIDPAIGNALLGMQAQVSGNTVVTPGAPLTATFGSTTPPAIATMLSNLNTQVGRLSFTNSIAPNFRMPADWKANISFKTTRLGLDWGIDAVYSRSDTNIAFRDLRARPLTINGVQQLTPDGRLRYDGLVIDPAVRAAQGLPVSSNPDLAKSVGLLGDIQAYNPGQQNWAATVAFSVGKRWKGFDAFLSYTFQDARQYGGISEFGTTEGGNGGTGNYYADQDSYLDPNGAVYGKAPNLMRSSWKLDLSYKMELVKGFTSHFTLFAESHTGRPLTFLMTDPTTSSTGHNPTFGVQRDDQLAYIPQLTSSNANPLSFTTPNPLAPGGQTTVIFQDADTLAKFKGLVSYFGLPQGKVVPRGFGVNPSVNSVSFQFAQEFPSPIKGHELLFTMDIANLGNLLNHNWGVVREYGGLTSRAGTTIINAQCADANGVIQGTGSSTCTTYVYRYNSATTPQNAAIPIVDVQASQWSVVFGLKYKF
ncbi:TonB-dependent receptor [Caulobacter sp. KR2-114]|uniref:TonB-dependent receptor n=1 Tax=Caulobacter sp. KR2-114 TaxID=3400912 RepID=UPI003BFA8F56